MPFSLSDIFKTKKDGAKQMITEYERQRIKDRYKALAELMEHTAPYPADYEGLQRIVAMLNQALSSKPLKDNHPRRTQQKP